MASGADAEPEPEAAPRPSEQDLSSYSDDRPASSPAAYEGGGGIDRGSRLRRHEWPDRQRETDTPAGRERLSADGDEDVRIVTHDSDSDSADDGRRDL